MTDEHPRNAIREDAPSPVVRGEEELHVQRVREAVGAARIRTAIEEDTVEELVGRGIEQADVERTGVGEVDSGEIETLPDGSVSIPVFEEQLVIERRLVVRERIIVRKHVITEEVPVTADLRRERVEVDVDPEVDGAVHLPPDPPITDARDLPGA